MDTRAKFEKWISSPPYEKEIGRCSNDETVTAWPGQYWCYEVELAWQAFQQGAELDLTK